MQTGEWDIITGFFELLYVAVPLLIIGVPVALVIIFKRIGKTERELKRISSNMDIIYRRMSSEDSPPGKEAPASQPPETGTTPEPALEPAPSPAGMPPFAVQSADPQQPASSGPQAGAMAPAAKPKPPGKSLEQRITERWMVWLGGITMALGGSFLVKYSIDIGLFGPGVRITMGILAAAAMVVVGERLRRGGPMPQAVSGMLEQTPDYVPSALTAAGIFTAFATIYSAHALYDMIPGILAFALLAAVSFAGMALALVHGPMLAFLGLVGAYAVPAIVTLGDPKALSLFSYLLVVTVGALEVVRHRQWRHLALTALGISTLWVWLWMEGVGQSWDAIFVGLFGLALTAVYLLRLYPGSDPARPEDDGAAWYAVWGFPFWRQFAFAGAVSGGFIIYVATEMAGYTSASFGVAALYTGLCGWVARRDGRLDILLAGAGALVVVLLANWGIPPVSPTDAEALAEVADWGPVARPFVPVEFQPLAITGAGFAVLFLAGGFAGLWGARRPGFWASISAVMPLTIATLVYWRIHSYAPNLEWAITSLALGALLLALGERVARYRHDPGMNAALGAYAVGVTAAVALAMTMLLENAWLTVALAIELPAIAWIWKRLDVDGLKTTALVLAGVVLVRLAANPYTLDYAISGSIPGINWLLYGYGLPALAFYAARRLFGGEDGNRLRDVLEAGAIIFAFLLVTLELRSLLSETGSVTGSYRFAERAIQTVNWMGFSLLLLRLEGQSRRPFYAWMRHALMALLVFNIFVLGGIWEILTPGAPVGPWPIFNLLLVAYAIPGVLAVFLYRAANDIGAARTAKIYGVGALVLIFIWLNFEVRHAFHGSDLSAGPETDAEAYAYSIAWLAYSGALLAAGLLRQIKVLRHASLAVLMLAVLKVFFFDLGQLEGLWRALSFMGLGAVLVGIGYLYRRFVFPPAQEVSENATPDEAP